MDPRPPLKFVVVFVHVGPELGTLCGDTMPTKLVPRAFVVPYGIHGVLVVEVMSMKATISPFSLLPWKVLGK
jgi:hypothetical protein